MLRTFEVAARKMSFSLAAEELNISQAAVSQQIRNLERYLGNPLFVRNHRKLSFTSVGADYYGAVHKALSGLDNVTDRLFPDRPNQSVTIICSSSIAMLWLAPNIGAFHLTHPAIQLRIQTLDSDMKTAQPLGADLEIFVSGNRESAADTQLLFRSSISPVAAPALLEKGRHPKKPNDILAYDLVHVTGYDEDWHTWFQEFGLDAGSVPVGLSVDGSLIALETALHGDGIVLGRRPFIDQYLRSGQLVEVFAKSYTLSTNYYLRRSKVKATRRPVDLVVDWLTQMAQDVPAVIAQRD